MKSKVTKSKPEAGARGHKNLKVVEVAFTPTLEAGARLKQVYDLLLSPQEHKGENQDTEE